MIIERIYEIPSWEVTKRQSIVIYDAKGVLYNDGWYGQYRVIDERELEKVNKIWRDLTEENY